MTILTINWVTDSIAKGFGQLVTRKKYQVADTEIGNVEFTEWFSYDTETGSSAFVN